MSETEKRELDIKTADGVAHAWAYRPPGFEKVPAVLFFIDALAVRPAMHAMAQRLATKGYLVLMPNIFYRVGEIAPFDVPNVWGNPTERARVMALIQGLTLDMAMRDAGAYLDALAADPHTRADRLGTVGYCLGGRLAFATAGHHPSRVRAAASIHGGHLVGEGKDSPHLLSDKLEASIYLAVADNDGSCTPAHQGALATALGAAHRDYRMELYAGKQHGFAVPDHGVYDQEAAERHWTRLRTFFGETLG